MGISDKLQNTLCDGINIKEERKYRSRSKKSEYVVGYEKYCSVRDTTFKRRPEK